MFDGIPDRKLKEELANRKKVKKKVPAKVREPGWYKLIDYCVCLVLGLFLIALSPLWSPFWVAYKIQKWSRNFVRQNAIKEDWDRYHPKGNNWRV
jgi:hypothetical protein